MVHLIHAGIEAGATGTAGGRLAIVSGETHAFRGQPVQVGRLDYGMTGAGQAVPAELIQGNEEYVQAQSPKDLMSLAEVNDTFASSLCGRDQLLWR